MQWIPSTRERMKYLRTRKSKWTWARDWHSNLHRLLLFSSLYSFVKRNRRRTSSEWTIDRCQRETNQSLFIWMTLEIVVFCDLRRWLLLDIEYWHEQNENIEKEKEEKGETVVLHVYYWIIAVEWYDHWVTCIVLTNEIDSIYSISMVI